MKRSEGGGASLHAGWFDKVTSSMITSTKYSLSNSLFIFHECIACLMDVINCFFNANEGINAVQLSL